MKHDFIHHLFWNSDSSIQYLHGSKVAIWPDKSVLFENSLLPSGTTILEWGVQQAGEEGILSPLPILDRETPYLVSAHFSSIPAQTAYLKLECYDKFDQQLSYQIIRSEETQSIVLPAKTDYYHFKLISSGCATIQFEHIAIASEHSQKSVSNHYTIDTNLSTHAEDNSLSIYFTEPERNGKYILEAEELHFPNKIIVSSNYNYHQLYLNRHFVQELQDSIAQIQEQNGLTDLIFIGYGPVSNMAALFFKELYTTSAYAVISDDFWKEEKYYRMIEKYSDVANVPNFFDLYLSQYDERIYPYMSNNQVNVCLPYLKPAIQTLDKLNYHHFLHWKP